MQWNKNTGSVMLAVGVLIGGVAAVGLSARAQDSATSPSSPAIVSAAVQTATPNVSTPADKNDTDNIQDPGGKEQPDAVVTQTGKQDAETNDDQAEVNDKGVQDGQEVTEKSDSLTKLATLLNMSSTDLQAALKAGTTITDLATKHGITQAQLDQFNAAQKQAKLDARKQELAQEVVSGKITQVQMDQQLQTMAVGESNEKNDANDPSDASEGVEKNGGNDANEQGG